MAIRWRAGDSLMYNAVTDAGERLRKAYEQAEAGKAYREGSTAAEGTTENPYVGLMKTDEVRQLSPEDYASMADYSANPANAKAAPSRMDRHRGGLMSQAERLFGSGRTEEAGRLLERASNLESAEQQRELGKIQIKSATRGMQKDEAKDAVDKEVSELLTKSHLHEPGTPEHEAILKQINSKVTGAYGSVQGQDYMTKQFALSEARREADIKRRNDAMVVASKTPEATVKSYNKYFKDGSTAELVDNKDGSKSIVQIGENGEKMGELVRYKNWETEGRPRVLLGIPEFAKEEYKLNLAHDYKIKEIKAQGDEHARYARILAVSKDKDIKLSETEMGRFKVLDQALRDAEDDPKKLAKAYRDMHVFNNSVRMAHGKTPMPWSGGGATEKAPTAMSAADIKAFREMAVENLSGTKGFKDMDDASKAAAVDRETKRMMDFFGSGANVRGLQGDRNRPADAAPAGGGLSAVAALAERAGARVGTPSAPGPSSPDDWIKPRRGGFYVDAPPRSGVTGLSDRAFPTRDAASRELRRLYGNRYPE